MFVEINYASSIFAGKDGRIAELLEVAVYVLLQNPITHPEETPQKFLCPLFFGNSCPWEVSWLYNVTERVSERAVALEPVLTQSGFREVQFELQKIYGSVITFYGV